MYDYAASTIKPRSGTGRVRQELGPDKQGGFHQELGPDRTVCQKSGPEHSVRQESGPECIRRVLHVLCLQGSSSAAARAGPTGAASGPSGVQQQPPPSAAAGAGPIGAADGQSGVQQLEAHLNQMHSFTTELHMGIVERAAAELVNPNGFDLELELARVIEEDEARTGEILEEALIHKCVARGDISSEQLDRLVASASEVFMSRVIQI